MSIRVILWLMSSFAFASSLLCPLLLLSCSRSTDSALSDNLAFRERVAVSGSLTEDTVWDQGKDYLVVGDVIVQQNSLLTIEPDVHIFFRANTEEDYYGHIVKGRLTADGGDSLHAIRFASVFLSVGGDVTLWSAPGSWRGV